MKEIIYVEKMKDGQFFTPYDIIDFIDEDLKNNNTDIKSVYDPTSGGCAFLDYFKQRYNCETYGQELDKSFVEIGKEKGHEIKEGNLLEIDCFKEQKFDLILSNPPFGVKFNKKDLRNDFKFIPRTSDGQVLFLQHVINKLKDDGVAYCLINGSPLFSGDAGSSESDFRKYIFENNLVDEIIQLPTNLFYNTSITVYIMKIRKNKTNNKVKLINLEGCHESIKNIEKKNRVLKINDKKEIKEFDNEYFFYNKQSIKIERKDEETGDIKKENDYEIIPFSFKEDQNNKNIKEFLNKWVEIPYKKTTLKTGAEVNFNKIFYKPEELRPLKEIQDELWASHEKLTSLMKEVFNG